VPARWRGSIRGRIFPCRCAARGCAPAPRQKPGALGGGADFPNQSVPLKRYNTPRVSRAEPRPCRFSKAHPPGFRVTSNVGRYRRWLRRPIHPSGVRNHHRCRELVNISRGSTLVSRDKTVKWHALRDALAITARWTQDLGRGRF